MHSLVFGNKQGRNSTLKEMTVNMPLEYFGKFDIKKEIKYLRAIFQTKQSKTDKSERSGARTNHMHKSPMQWFYEGH
jgi:protein involved in sex pheromone biosynthesis